MNRLHHPLSFPLPGLFTTEGEESFARRSIRDRHAATLLQVVEQNRVEEPYRARLLAFRTESLGGRFTDPFAHPPGPWDPGLFEARELEDWRRAIAPHAGRSWWQLPWCFAESVWFLKLLFAFGYYEPSGPHRLQDPFAPLKEKELTQPGGGLEAAANLAPLLQDGRPPEEVLRELCLAALWGNRMDLSMHGLAREYRGSFLQHQAHELLIDHSGELAARLLAAGRVDVILDNAGPELVCDLLLAGCLLGRDRSRRVVLHAKRSPFYVSDARPADIRTTVNAMASSTAAAVRAAGRLLAGLVSEGRLEIREHWFWNGPRFFDELPLELHSELARSELVLLKGDANYRRLVGDRHWPSETPMEALTTAFPAPFAVLRTMKSEIVVDIPRARARQLDRQDPDWRTNGRRGIIRVCGR